MSGLFANIPHELRALKQWVLWRYEDVGGSKPTKVPYQLTGKPASVNDPKTWASFQDCTTVFNAGHYSGIGFVFSDNDPFSFIDLDDTEGDDALLQRHLKVYHEFNSYSEVSPSGKGLHIIVEGVIPAGRRRSKIEVYSSQRYATMTGNVHNSQNAIRDCQELLTRLWEQMGSGPVAQAMFQGTDKETDNDEAIIKRATEAINGDKFLKLWSGNWAELYQSQSEADFAIIDILAFYTQNRIQIGRIFRTSQLGKRDKASRQDYLNGMITRSFDRMLPPLDFDGLKNQLELKLAEGNNNQRGFTKTETSHLSYQPNSFETKEPDLSKSLQETQSRSSISTSEEGQFKALSSNSSVHSTIQSNSEMQQLPGSSSSMSGFSSQRPNTETNEGIINDASQPQGFDSRNTKVHSNMRELPQKVTLPQGLIGEMAQFIYNAAPRPVPEVALSASIALMAGICGRAYNISGTGLNQYVLLLAMTGAGKEAAASGINKLMNTIKMQVPSSSGFIGPSEISSGAALFKYLGNNSQSFISLLGEFGLRLQQMSSPNANGSEVSLRRMFLDLYNKSGYSEILHASVYSDKANNTSAVPSPSFSILGESTPERFYGALNEDMISEGLLPRFLLIEYKGNRPALNEAHTTVIPSFSLVERLAALAAQCETINHSNPRRVVNVGTTDEAAKLLHDFDKYADAKINGSNKEVIRQLWNRAHIKVLKLSALLAVGQNMIDPTINEADMRWAAQLVQNDISIVTDKFEAGEIGANTFEVRQAQDIIRMIKEYVYTPYDKIEKYIQFKSQPMHADKIIPYVYLNKRLSPLSSFRNDKAGSTIAIKRAIQNLVDSDRIREVGKNWVNDKYGTSQRAFVISDISLLN